MSQLRFESERNLPAYQLHFVLHLDFEPLRFGRMLDRQARALLNRPVIGLWKTGFHRYFKKRSGFYNLGKMSEMQGG